MGMTLRVAIAASFAFCSYPSLAESADPVTASEGEKPARPEASRLWATLTVGDSPQVVSDKLLAMPEIKAVRLKRKIDDQGDAMSISYKDGGFSVIDEKLMVKPIFKNGGLSDVALYEVGTCANTIWERYSRIKEVLAEKYPGAGLLPEKPSEGVFSSKRYGATPQMPTEYAEVVTSDAVAVELLIHFTRSDPPVTAYGAGAVTDLLSGISLSVYNTKSKECGGTGRYRADILLRYMTHATFEAETSKTIDSYKAGNAKAAERL